MHLSLQPVHHSLNPVLLGTKPVSLRTKPVYLGLKLRFLRLMLLRERLNQGLLRHQPERDRMELSSHSLEPVLGRLMVVLLGLGM